MIETNMTKKDIESLENNPYFGLFDLFFGKEKLKELLEDAKKQIETDNKTSQAETTNVKQQYIPPKITVKPEVTTIHRTVTIDKDRFIKFIDAFANAVNDLDSIAAYGITFDTDSPVNTYENLLSGLLESIFGKDSLPVITNYVYGDSTDSAEIVWNKIKNI